VRANNRTSRIQKKIVMSLLKKLLFFDLLALGAVTGLILMDLSYDVHVLGGHSDRLHDACVYYAHGQTSWVVQLFIPTLLGTMALCSVARLLVYRSVYDVVHVLLFSIGGPAFVLYVVPAEERMPSHLVSAANDTAFVHDLLAIAYGHIGLICAAVFGFFLQYCRHAPPPQLAADARKSVSNADLKRLTESLASFAERENPTYGDLRITRSDFDRLSSALARANHESPRRGDLRIKKD
jgi:hypothetical protein